MMTTIMTSTMLSMDTMTMMAKMTLSGSGGGGGNSSGGGGSWLE